ncbi:hypothetical protein, partial [Phocaeicola vulgatus]
TFAFGLYKGHYTYPMVAQFSTGILAHFSISIYRLSLKNILKQKMPIAGNYGNGHFLLSGFICQIPAKYAKFFSIPLCIPIFATIRKWTYSAGNMKRVRVILTLFAYVLMAGFANIP